MDGDVEVTDVALHAAVHGKKNKKKHIRDWCRLMLYATNCMQLMESFRVTSVATRRWKGEGRW